MAVIDRQRLDKLLEETGSYSSETAKQARLRIRELFNDARDALAEHEALNRNLQKQTDEKVDLQVRVRELERELELANRPMLQPNPAISVPIYPTGARTGWGIPNETDPNAPFQQIFNDAERSLLPSWWPDGEPAEVVSPQWSD